MLSRRCCYRNDNRRPEVTASRTRRLRVVVLSFDGTNVAIASILRGGGGGGDNKRLRQIEEKNERLAESRYLACHEIHVHRSKEDRIVDGDDSTTDTTAAAAARMRRRRNRRHDNYVRIFEQSSMSAAAATSPTMLLLHKDITRDARYDRAVNAWMRRCSDRIFRRRRGEDDVATPTVNVVVRNIEMKKYSCDSGTTDCSRVLVPYELYDVSGDVSCAGGRKNCYRGDGGSSLHESTMLYVVRADIVVIAYDPADDGSLSRTLSVLAAVRSKEGNDDASSTVVALIENNRSHGGGGGGGYVNPNSIRSLRNYYRDVEEITVDETSDIITLSSDELGSSATTDRFFASIGNSGERNNRYLMDLILTRVIASVLRPDEKSIPFASTVTRRPPPKHVSTWMLPQPNDETTAVDDSDERLDNAINELASLDTTTTADEQRWSPSLQSNETIGSGSGGNNDRRGLRNFWRRLKALVVINGGGGSGGGGDDQIV